MTTRLVRHTRGRFVAALAAGALAWGCDPGAEDGRGTGGAGTAQRPIVGGSPESGYAGVGALVVDYGGVFESFCTGTLLADRWVLTAAHCLSGTDVPEAYQTSFFVGPDATRPSTGTAYEADAFYPHPRYDASDHSNDIGLVYLAEPATGVAPYPYNTTSLSGYVGSTVRWVGYGINSVSPDSGGGIKRSATGRIAEIYLMQIVYDWEGALPCRGDSGGPAFLSVSGREVVAGVVSAGDESCRSSQVDTRVDAFATWIDSTMRGSAGHTDCDILGGDCGGETCWLVDTDYWGCVPGSGRGEGTSCDPDPDAWGETLPCGDGLICMETLPESGEGRCVRFCRAATGCGGTDYCMAPVFADSDDVGACLPTCEITGGSCPSGRACYFMEGGGALCFPSAGGAPGADCDPYPPSGADLPCADGLVCVRTGGVHVGECTNFCRGDAECTADQRCDIPIVRDVPDVGACVCRDDDVDGWCRPDDCDDANRAVNPAAAEVCGNGIDDNCVNGVDESCGCTDGDGDTYCPPDDCDDGNAAVNPGAAEACGNGVDDNCRDGTDEGCGCGPGAVDGDGDGYCPPEDCNDGNAAVNPAAAEVCGNGVDDNCRDGTDETCGCTDNDGDGYCEADDCDDWRATTSPGAPEICGDNEDNDCDGAWDEDDTDCPFADDGGCGCAIPASRGGGGLLAALLLGFVLRRRTRRRR